LTTLVDVDEIEAACWDADISCGDDEDDYEGSLYREYSGRYMYGSHCFGITGHPSDFARFICQLTQRNADLAWILSQAVTTDNMGRDTIFYFPGYQLGKEDSDAEGE